MKLIPIIAMAGIITLEAIALIKGINGAAFSFAVMLLAGLGGYEIRILREKRKEKK